MILFKNCFYIHSPEVEDTGAGWDILLEGNRIRRIAPEIDEAEVRRGAPGAPGQSGRGDARGGGDGAPRSADARNAEGPAARDGDRPAAGPGDAAARDAECLRVIDASRHVVVPGFINTHHHFYQTLTRNIPEAQNAKLFDWLVFHYEVWKHMTPEDIRNGTRLAVAELLKTGCTCTTDHHYLYPQGFAEDLMGLQFGAADELGIRFAPTRGSMSRGRSTGGLPPDSVVQDEEEILADCERVIREYHDPSELAMHKVILAPCSPFSVTPDLMKKSVDLARGEGVRLHTHLAETLDEDDYCLETYGKRPLAVMEDWGFIGPDVFYAHGIHFTDDELVRLAETATGVSHCPSSNMRLGSGIARVKEMHDRGIPVSLGVDGSASNDASDYLGEMRNALLLQRIRYGAAGATARMLFEIATINGARTLGFPRCGEIRADWAADIALFNVHKLEYAGALSDPLAALIFAGINHSCDYTIVNGEVVVDGGRLIGVDEDDIFTRAHRSSERMIAAARGTA